MASPIIESMARWAAAQKQANPPFMPGDDEKEPEKTKPYDGGPWLTTAQIFEPLPPTRWVVPDLQIGPGRPACLAGYAYGGKTVAMQSAVLAIATDRPIWGWYRHPHNLRVRHADQDQGKGTLRRYQRLARGMGITPEELEGRLEVSTFPSLYLVDTPDDVWLRACDGIDLMILDAMRGFLPGIEENDSEIQAYLMKLAKYSDQTGCSFWIAHHFGKGNDTKSDLEKLRGSSGIGAALGSVIVLSGEKDEPRKASHCKGHPDGCGKLESDFCLVIEDVVSDDGADATWGLKVTYQTPEQVSPPLSPKQQVKEVAEAILGALRDYPEGLSARALRPLVKQQALIQTALEYLQRTHAIEAMQGMGRGPTHAVYRTTNESDGANW